MALIEVSSYFCTSQMPQVKGPAGSWTKFKKQLEFDIMSECTTATWLHMLT